jgi:hypothetical protein
LRTTKWIAAHDGVRGSGSEAGSGGPKSRLPAHAGTAVFGDPPTRRRQLVERSAGARGRAEHGVGCAPLRLLGGKVACHRFPIVRLRSSQVK